MSQLENQEENVSGQETENSPTFNATVSSPSSSEQASLIGEHMSIEGSLVADENMIIEGSLKGSIVVKSHQLTVGKKGRVEADIEAENVVISGRMTGNINAFNKVHITEGADFNGQIKARRIAVEDGCFLKASIELNKEASDKSQATPQGRIKAIAFPSEAPSDTIRKSETKKASVQN